MNHLILISLLDNRIHNLKGLIDTYTYCINENIGKDYNISLKQKSEKDLEILERNRKAVFDNYLLFQ